MTVLYNTKPRIKKQKPTYYTISKLSNIYLFIYLFIYCRNASSWVAGILSTKYLIHFQKVCEVIVDWTNKGQVLKGGQCTVADPSIYSLGMGGGR